MTIMIISRWRDADSSPSLVLGFFKISRRGEVRRREGQLIDKKISFSNFIGSLVFVQMVVFARLIEQ